MLGGSSALNGSAWVPPSQAGIDAWAALGNPRWNWSTVLPYLEKTYTITKPGEDPGQGGGGGPVQVTYPALEEGTPTEPLINAWNEALKDQGYDFTSNILGGPKTIGTRAYTAAIDPDSHSRSSTSTYAQEKRSNLRIITGATVRKIPSNPESERSDRPNPRAVATGVEAELDGQIVSISAEKDVILAAGAFHTPKILELSGVGQKDRLTELGIPVVMDLPGVGENLQNHVWSILPTPLKVEGVQPGIKTLAFTHLDKDEQENLISDDPNDQTSDRVIKSILGNPDNASACLALSAMPGGVALLVAISSFPFSRGSCHCSSANIDAKPTVDPQFFANELDIETMARHVQNLYKLSNAPAFEDILQPLEVPQLETIKSTLRGGSALATHHSCGTAAMLPREAGGVVNENLRVYGTKNVRVVDASVFPLIPHANPMSTVYAVAEKAVDMMNEPDVSEY
ncbi:hypothetical protein AtubIFM57258_000645 [Aspergillus tubingensis]|nr:hypothetical protein AtubIFM57258_000645 [Aspergillus tubingensis]